ncbi:ATPase P-type K/Mg/Cd/Cu/Zn/Na/Ca/Na/H-transporter, partial [Penicillium cataractarum]
DIFKVLYNTRILADGTVINGSSDINESSLYSLAIVGIIIRGYNGPEATIKVIIYAITVLIISYLYTIGLAIPIVIVISSGVTAEKGIIFKLVDTIEVAYKTSHVMFDKTGTLTRGKLSIIIENYDNVGSLSLLLRLIENSLYPVSVSVATYLKDASVTASTIPKAKSLTSIGVKTTFSGRKLRLVYSLEDKLRPNATRTIESLQKRGISVYIVSGDDNGAI